MGRIIRRHLRVLACGAALLGLPASLVAQTPPPPIGGLTGTIALEGTVDETSKAANAVIVKTRDGIRHLFHTTDKTPVHGVESVEVEGLDGLRPGSAVVVHYVADAGEQTAVEVDWLGDKGLQAIRERGVPRRPCGKKTRFVSPTDSAQTLRLTD